MVHRGHLGRVGGVRPLYAARRTGWLPEQDAVGRPSFGGRIKNIPPPSEILLVTPVSSKAELISPLSHGVRKRSGINVGMLNSDDVMTAANSVSFKKNVLAKPDRLVDFRYLRKKNMASFYKAVFLMKIINGIAFPDSDRFMASEITEEGTYQKPHFDAAMKYVKTRNVAVDGGAHIGAWTRSMSKLFKRVISFEPSGDTFECLAYNMKAFKCKNVDIRRAALGQHQGRVRMTLDGFEKAIAAGNTGARFVAAGDEVDVITLDSRQLDDLNFLKLDIEGSEVDALMGAKETLLRCQPIILFEDKNFWKRYGYSRRAPHEFLSSLGATHCERAGMDEIWGWK